MTSSFGSRLGDVFTSSGRLCMGIDPHPYLLDAWGLPDSADGAREFGLRCVDAAAGTVGIVKPQIAFFERFGSVGYAALEEVLASARAAELLVIGDVKRGEIGSSMAGYAEGWLTPGSPLEVDAMTLNPYLGVETLAETYAAARRVGKGVLVLAATSNPEAASLQQARTQSGTTISRDIVDSVARWNAAHSDSVGSAGVVIGGTQSLDVFGLDVDAKRTPVLPVLAPGFGHQGAQAKDATRVFGEMAAGVIVSESRSILSAGPQELGSMAAHRAEEVRKSFV